MPLPPVSPYQATYTTTQINGSRPQLTAAAYPALHYIGGQRLGVLRNAFDVKITEEMLNTENGQEILDFSLPARDINASLIDSEMQIRFAGSVFRVRTAEDGTSENGEAIIAVHCEALWYDLGIADAILVNPGVTNPTTAINTICAGTGWVAGSVVAVSGGTYTVTQRATPLAALRDLPGTFGGELWFDNVNRTVNLVSVRGDQSGNRLYIRGSNLQSSKRTRDTTNFATRVRPVGANNIDITSVNGGLPYIDDYSFYDNRGASHQVVAQLISNDQLTSPTALLAWGRAQLSVLSQPKLTYTVNVAQLTTESTPGLGDRVRVVDKSIGLNTFSRVVQRDWYPLEPSKTTLQINTAAYTLNNAINTPGNSLSGAGGQTGQNFPNAPSSVTISTNQGLSPDGTYFTYGNISWPAVTTNVDGSTLFDLNNYEVQYSVDGGAWTVLGRTTDTSTQTPPFRATASIIARVRAWTAGGNAGGWTQSSATAVRDTVAPPRPSIPVVNNSLPLALQIFWNGLDLNGNIQPIDFARLEVHCSTVSGFTPTVTGSNPTLVDNISNPNGGIGVAAQLTAGTTYWIGIRAVDRTGNIGAITPSVSGVAQLVQTGHLADLAVIAAKLAQGAATTEKISQAAQQINFVKNGGFEDPSATLGASWPASWSSQDSGGTSSRVTTGQYSGRACLQQIVPVPNTSYGNVLSDIFTVIPGEVYAFSGAYKTNLASPGGSMYYRVHWFDSAGAEIFPYMDIVNNGTASTSWVPASAAFTAPVTARTAAIELWSYQYTAVYTGYWDAIRVGRVFGTVDILDAAITSAKIANLAVGTAAIQNLAVTDALIGSVSAGKITVGTLNADVTIASRIKTANTGSRVELNSAGLYAYNASGTQTVKIDTSGNVVIIGQLSTGTTGPRVVLDQYNGVTNDSSYAEFFTGAAAEKASGIIGQVETNGTLPSPKLTVSAGTYKYDGATGTNLTRRAQILMQGTNSDGSVDNVIQIDCFKNSDGSKSTQVMDTTGWIAGYKNASGTLIDWVQVTNTGVFVTGDSTDVTISANGSHWINFNGRVGVGSAINRLSPTIAPGSYAFATLSWIAMSAVPDVFIFAANGAVPESVTAGGLATGSCRCYLSNWSPGANSNILFTWLVVE